MAKRALEESLPLWTRKQFVLCLPVGTDIGEEVGGNKQLSHAQTPHLYLQGT